ncbi:MAG: TIGR04076 family protein [Chlamydiae bacterium]|nr:TIGR04076 family protein [Chlamydiota bacterium]
MQKDDSFELYDIKVEVINNSIKPMVCNHKVGDYFLLSGENFSLPDGQSFPIYCLAALIPIITVKQRFTSPNDWISTDHEVACPDINCGGVFKISRMGKKTFYHHQVTRAQKDHE